MEVEKSEYCDRILNPYKDENAKVNLGKVLFISKTDR
jgi:hypothetical protein